MKARMILGAAGYRPEQLALLTGVLESVWARCKADYLADQVEAARERLALIIIDLAGRDVPVEPGAFEALYRSPSNARWSEQAGH